MSVAVAERVDRPPSLFDSLDVVEAPQQAPARPAGEPTALERRLLRERETYVREAEGWEATAPATDEQDAGTDAGGTAHTHGGVGGEPTLDELIVGAWEGLAAQAAVQCPLCEGALRPVRGRDVNGGASAVVGGRCDSCATMLS
ncbi:hypothetical protein [Conexibacter sp. CPCC 206217]|uniref:hypothetical protein n=1 Tax=Conexibacter sp. CPCC 206217 TaxID=3064574 RepID=UPI0027160AC5|nr:hypothetical protein [Conexibacter sp. CPCC 206217]MDO8213645.1 hypothetical protein [Conexibacter sp. CPCC 206217]